MLEDLIHSIEGGVLLPADGMLEVVPPPSPRTSAVVAFTAHAVAAASLDETWVRDQLPDGDLAAPMSPPFLTALASRLDRSVNCIDMVLVATPLDGRPPGTLTRIGDHGHPRVRRAMRYREDIVVWTTPGGVLILGRGLAGRWEAAIEVDPAARGDGLGCQLANAARHLVPADRAVWAQVTPGNAASVRTFLNAGYAPVGSEALLVTRGGSPPAA